MLKSNSAEMAEDVLHLSVSSASLVTAQVGNGLHFGKNEVDDGNNDDDTDGVTPDDDDSDDRGLNGVWHVTDTDGAWASWVLPFATVEPAEHTEECGDGIDNQDSTDKFPVRPGLTASSDEDQPVLNERDLQEEHKLNVTEVLDHTTTGQEE